MTSDYKAKRDLAAHGYEEHFDFIHDSKKENCFKDGADWAARFVLEHESVNALVLACRLNRDRAWDYGTSDPDAEQALTAFEAFKKSCGVG